MRNKFLRAFFLPFFVRFSFSLFLFSFFYYSLFCLHVHLYFIVSFFRLFVFCTFEYIMMCTRSGELWSNEIKRKTFAVTFCVVCAIAWVVWEWILCGLCGLPPKDRLYHKKNNNKICVLGAVSVRLCVISSTNNFH